MTAWSQLLTNNLITFSGPFILGWSRVKLCVWRRWEDKALYMSRGETTITLHHDSNTISEVNVKADTINEVNGKAVTLIRVPWLM